MPRWVLETLGLDKAFVVMSHFGFAGPTISRRGPMRSLRVVNGRVCPRCNSGWMSRLEARVKPLLTPLMELDPSRLSELEENKTDLARWVIKTAALLNHASNYRQLVPLDHFQALYEGEVPKNVHVNLGFTSSEDRMCLQSQSNLAFGDAAEVMAAAQHSYRISLQLGHLLLRAVYFPLTNIRQTKSKPLHLARVRVPRHTQDVLLYRRIRS